MWNDEDNNPYGTSFDRRDSTASSSVNPTSPTSRDCECGTLAETSAWRTSAAPWPASRALPRATYPADTRVPDRSFDAPHTPTSGSDDDVPAFGRGAARTSDHETARVEDAAPRRKPGGYTSRIEQILYENPDLPIIITDAGKSLESGGRYIVYTIQTGVCLPPTPSCLPLID